MLLLAVDTTTAYGSVALAEDGRVVGELHLGRSQVHSVSLLPAIVALLRSLEAAPAHVDAWAASVGPGAFTGLRVGLSTIQGLALATGRPCVGISALQAHASRLRGEGAPIVVVLDAYGHDVYGQLFDAEAQPASLASMGPIEALLELVPPAAVFGGSDSELWRGAVTARCSHAVFPQRGPYLAAEVARLASDAVAAGRVVAAHALRPIYLRDTAFAKTTAR